MVRRGNIYFLDPGPTTGNEQRGHRPYLVISTNSITRKFGIAIVIPGTTGSFAANIDSRVVVRVSAQETGMKDDSAFLCHQIVRLDVSKFPRRTDGSFIAAGSVSSDTLDKLQRGVEICLGFLPSGSS